MKGLDTVTNKENMAKKDAEFFKKVVDEVMVAMCINFTGSEPWLAPAELSYVRMHKTNLAGYASLQTDVSCDTCPEVDYPAKVDTGICMINLLPSIEILSLLLLIIIISAVCFEEKFELL